MDYRLTSLAVVLSLSRLRFKDLKADSPSPYTVVRERMFKKTNMEYRFPSRSNYVKVRQQNNLIKYDGIKMSLIIVRMDMS